MIEANSSLKKHLLRKIYKKIANRLNKGKKVLFIGLPCQAAAVIHYTHQNENLFTVDLICHGTPSPIVLELALQSYGYELSAVAGIRFRSKTLFEIQKESNPITPKGVRDLYTHLFLEGVSYTENCYNCKYARKDRVTDITIGDSWGSKLDNSEQEKGISLILCQTERGRQLVQNANLELHEVDLDNAVRNNRQLQAPMVKPAERDAFFKLLKEGSSFSKAVKRVFPKRYYKNIIKTTLLKLRMWRGGGVNNRIDYSIKIYTTR